MSKWPMVSLGEVMTLEMKATPVLADQEYPNFGIYSFGRGLFSKPPISGATTSATNLYQVRTGQFIYSRLFAFEGAYGLVGEEFDGYFISNEYPHFNCDLKRLNPAYLATYFRWRKAWEQAATLSTGMGDRRRRIQPEQLLKMTIPLPALKEQQRIVEYLAALSNKVEEAKQLRAEADEEHRWLWQGASRKLIGQLGDIPWFPVGELCEIFGGGTPSKQNPHFWGGDIPWISPKDMKTREITGAIDKITQDGLASSSTRMLPTGAVLIVIRGMILVHTVPVGILRVPATINQDMKALVPKNVLLPEFLCSVLWGLNQELLACIDKSSHDTRKLTTPKLMDFRIPVPSLDVQRKLISDTEELNKTRRLVHLVAEDCGSQIQALMPTVFNQVFNGGAA